MSKLTETDYKQAAELLNCEVAAIQAVAQVESNGNGFLKSGLLIIRFEAGIFQKLTNHVYDKTHPDLSHAYIPNDPSNKGVLSDYNRLALAKTLNEKAALQSCSYGKFQIMGQEYWRCGYKTVRSFVTNQQQGEQHQLLDFCQFIISKKLVTALQTKDWNTFAYKYNGRSYKKNKYHIKMKKYYELFAKRGNT